MAAANQPSVATPLVGREVRVGEASAMDAVGARSMLKQASNGAVNRLKNPHNKKALRLESWVFELDLLSKVD